METRRVMYAESVSGSAVQLRRHPNHGPLPDSDGGLALHQVNIVTGVGAAATADAGYWLTGCVLYEVIIRRLG